MAAMALFREHRVLTLPICWWTFPSASTEFTNEISHPPSCLQRGISRPLACLARLFRHARREF
jgi:hypothetical protein